MKNVIFNYLPPSQLNTPSPAFSVLKSFLEQHNYKSEVKYWNLLFSNLLNNINNEEIISIIPFINLINKYYNDSVALTKSELFVMSENTTLFWSDKSMSETFMANLYSKIATIIGDELMDVNADNTRVIGFSSKFEQWIPAIILARYYKIKMPNVPIIIGGFGNPDVATEVMKICGDFDFAFWGEGEYPLLEFLKELDTSHEFSKVSRLVYRNDNQIVQSLNKTSTFVDFNKSNIHPNFDDYFKYTSKTSHNLNVCLPVETSRGCHWKKCKFCFLNQGYKYRQMPAENIVNQLMYQYDKFNIHEFGFLDNDLVGNDIDRFVRFLDLLIETKDKGYDFRFIMGEVITSQLNSEIVKKMVLAGFVSIQIGYESISDTILKKMDKKQGFSDNLCFIKFSLKYGLKVLGANIISLIIDESDEDIIESIENLHYLRFILNKNQFVHDLISLELSEGSKYFKMVPKNELEIWNSNSYMTFLSPKLFENINRFRIFGFQKGLVQKDLWIMFNKSTETYVSRNYNYKLIYHNNIPIYKEFIDDKEIKSISFDEPFYWEIMSIANDVVRSFDFVLSELNKNELICTESLLKSILVKLKNEYLIYFNNDMSKIITVIDTSIIS